MSPKHVQLQISIQTNITVGKKPKKPAKDDLVYLQTKSVSTNKVCEIHL